MRNRIKRTSIVLAAIMLMLSTFVVFSTDEFTVTALLKVVNGSFSLTRTVSNYQTDQTGNAVDYGIQSVAVGATNNLNINNVSTPYWMFVRNLDLTNDIFVTCVIQLRAGDLAILPVDTTNMTTYSTTGTNSLEYWVNQE